MGRAIAAGLALASVVVGGGIAWVLGAPAEPAPEPVRAEDSLVALAEHAPPARPEPEPERLDESAESDTPAPLVLRAPPVPNRWTGTPVPPDPEGRRAAAFWFNAQVHAAPRAEGQVKGIIRRGHEIRVEDRVGRRGCPGGWYPIAPSGFICNREGWVISSDPTTSWSPYENLREIMPYRYAAVTRGARRYPSFPADPTSEGEVLDGDYFVTVVDERTAPDGTRYLRTALEEWVRAEDTSPAATSALAGAELNDAELRLPLVFLMDETELMRLEGGTPRVVGRAEKYARFHLEREVEVDGTRYLVGEAGLAVAAEHARVARALERPERVPGGEAFIHVNLATQTLVAYEPNGRPVFATLVASGKEGYDTPSGTFQLREKYVSIAMTGEDPTDGPYEVEEVPWTMYYFQSYALHGAYWHDAFGRVRSHGCTNLAPHDARWLFDWTSPEVPLGWHGRRLRRGTWVHITS